MGLLSKLFGRRGAAAPPSPKSLTVELTSHCGYDCAPCPLNFYTEPVRRQHADAARLRRVIARAGPLETVDFTGWGEALLHPELIETVRCAAAHSKEVTLTTAGSLLRQEISRGLIDAGLTYLMISLDCATAERYRALKHKDEFDLVVDNAAAFLAARGGREKPRLALSFIVMKDNADEIEAFAELAAELGVDQIVFKQLVPFSDGERERSLERRCNPRADAAPARRTEEALARAMEIAAAAGVEAARFGDLERWRRHRCFAYAEERPFLRADGALAPCCMGAYPVTRVGESGGENLSPAVFGEWTKGEVEELWRDPAYAAFRDALADPGKTLPALCRDCPICHNFDLKVRAAAAGSTKKTVAGTL